MGISILIFIISVAVLVYSSDRFIGASEKIGLSFGISPFIIGVSIVAFGTSLPELATSTMAVMRGSSSIVIGNVIGSNITNILLVVGLAAISVKTLEIKRNLMDTDMSLLVGSIVLLWFVLLDGEFSWVETLIFCGGLFGFMHYSVTDKTGEAVERVPTSWLTYLWLLLGGVGVYFGAIYTVESLTDISTRLGIDPALVSLGALSLGTSLPEVAVSINAARRGIHEMAIGNVIGSNIFNTYAVMAIPSMFGKLEIPMEVLSFSMPFATAVTVMFGLLTYSRKITFWEAGLLLSFYVFFIAELINRGIDT